MGLDSSNQGVFITEMARVVKTLAERMHAQQVTTGQAIAEMQEAIKALDSAAIACKSIKSAVVMDMKRTIETAMTDAVNNAASDLTEKFNEADGYAIEAADRYESAARTIGWRMAGTIALVCFVLLGVSVYVVQGSLAPLAEIHALRQEKAQLQEAISKLEGRGARSISTCDYQKDQKLLCAYVVTDLKTDKRNWLFLATPK